MARRYTAIESIKKRIAGDVSRVEKYARFLFIVDEEGCPLSLRTLHNAPLNIIAVIGPTVYAGHTFSLALLLEIGLGRARPYHDAFAPAGVLEKGRWIAKRRNYSLLSAERFEVLWPYVCDVVIEHTLEVTGKWKHKSWNVPSSRARLVRIDRQKQIIVRAKEVEHSRGVRISVAFKDEHLLRTILELDMEHSKSMVYGEARLICLCLRAYANSDYTDRELLLFSGARAGKMRLLVESFGPRGEKEYGRLEPHHVAYMYAHKLIPPKNRALFERCASFFRLVDMNRVLFFEQIHFGRREEIPGFDVRVISMRRTTADYLVGEFIPRLPNIAKGDQYEECPF